MKNADNLNKERKIIEHITEAFGEGSIILPELGGHIFNEELEILSTGSPTIDKATGIGGFPFGKVIEILGQEASGKTTLALSVIAQAQRKGLRCAFIDSEQALDKKRAEAIGVDFEKLFISQPDNGEQGLNILDMLVTAGTVKVIVIDSVAALTPKAEIEGEMNDATIGILARNMGKILRKIVAPVNKNGILVIFTNQIRSKIGGFGFGPQETTPGGNALKFYAAMRVDCRRIGNNKSGERLISTKHKLTIKKNKMAPPMVACIVNIGERGFMEINEKER